MASVTSDALPGPDEQEVIAKIKDHFKEEFRRREQQGQLYDALFGDLAICRILRQKHHDLEASCKWMDAFLETFRELKGDDVVPDLVQRLDNIEKEGRMVRTEDLPGLQEVSEFVSLIFNADQLTKSGDPLSFYPLGELNKQQVMARGAFDRYERFVLHGWLLRALELERLSQRQQRLCRVVNIIDVTGCTLSKVICKEFDRRAEKMMQRLESLVPDLTAGNWVINAPWIMQKIFPWAKRSLKVKVDNWFLCKGNGEQDPDLLSIVDLEQLRALDAFRFKVKEENDQRNDESYHYIGPGQVLEKVVEATAGQRVSWKFVVLPGSRFLPPPEVRFCVVGIWDIPEAQDSEPGLRPASRSKERPVGRNRDRSGMVVEDGGALELIEEEDEEDGYQGLDEEVLHEGTWKTLDLENCGTVTSPKAGLVALRWSNEFNILRPKRIQLEIKVEEVEPAS
ncbi:unnamed protein product [Effrenium voratum]|nr:unnamed protein product [Effrenium voratum]